ncbi:TetR/AcrR family transcriptional regulator [Denitrobaculum tricleocarpae]|uniref:TetR/AcrR family transcriptional regulator n=1 Tax=Denitrobaculum tricleocarpae TaxID=2591009 RepID=A0A545TKR7_9PROT|nr:TetR/AcrR family transcriptional regulator [Denitrobaculum tricleocarpae]TQV77819.1 TetR/AcrR family transcriptional regulator [Denitrobaculum tricleocarpae]
MQENSDKSLERPAAKPSAKTLRGPTGGNAQRRSNKQRSESTRSALISAARRLFVEKGYAETGTPEIVAAAQVTRGALYHHFADKADLFRATLREEARAVADHIEQETEEARSALEAMTRGADSYFAAMSVPGRVRLLLLDGPAVLGHAEMAEIDQETGGEELRQGLAYAMEKGALAPLPLEAMTSILSAAFDRAALAIAQGAPAEDYKAAIRRMLEGLLKRA